jgi:hypothetical protein
VDDEAVSAAKARELEKQVRELQRVLGKKTMENEILREAVRLAHEKKLIAIAVAALGRFPMKAIADTLEVSRSNLIDQSSSRRAKRGRYSKADDDRLMPMIRAFVDERPTYGYRRITVLLNRKLRSLGHPRVNHKRVYRIMLHAGLLLQRHTGLRRGRAHDGVVRTL